MQRMFEGVIVASVLEAIGNTRMKSGFITIMTPDHDYVKLDVGSYTEFENLDEGVSVCVQADSLGETGVLYAKNVTPIEECSSCFPCNHR